MRARTPLAGKMGTSFQALDRASDWCDRPTGNLDRPCPRSTRGILPRHRWDVVWIGPARPHRGRHLARSCVPTDAPARSAQRQGCGDRKNGSISASSVAQTKGRRLGPEGVAPARAPVLAVPEPLDLLECTWLSLPHGSNLRIRSRQDRWPRAWRGALRAERALRRDRGD